MGKRAVDDAASVGRAHVRLNQFALEGVALVGFAQADAFKVAEFAVQIFQVAVSGQFKLQLLADIQAAETLGVFAAVDNVMQFVGRQTDFGKYGGKGVAIADGDAFMQWVDGCAGGSRSGLVVSGFSEGLRAFCGSDCGWSEVVFLLYQSFGIAAHVQIQRGAFGFYIAGRKYQQRKTQECGHATGGKQVAFGVQRWLGSRGHGLGKILRI